MEGDTALRHMLLERGLEDWEFIEEDCDKENGAETKSSTKFPSMLKPFFVPARHSPLEEKEQATTEVEGGAERLYAVPTTSSVTIDVPKNLEASLPENAQIVSSTIPSCTDQYVEDTDASFTASTIVDIENESDHEGEKNEDNSMKKTEEPLRSTRNWFLEYIKRPISKIVNKISSFFRSFLRVSTEDGRTKRL